MRGLLKASLLLAPALASALVVPDVDIEDIEVDRVIAGKITSTSPRYNGANKNFFQDHSFALIGVEIPITSPDEWAKEALAFRLDVFPSEEACGYGNVTVDGQVLPQKVEGDASTGKGHVTTDRKNIIGASWSFQCIKVNGQPDSQFLKFVIDVIDGKAQEDVGFSALFKQTGSTEIINIETDLSLPDQVVANPNPEGLRPVGDEEHELPQFSIEQEMDELHWMRAQLKELEYLIWMKEQAIHEHAHAHFEEEITDCDSLKCLAKAVVDKARKAAHKAINKIHGHHEGHGHEDDEEDFGHFPKPSFKKPKHGKPENCTHGKPPKHGNHTAPPHWKKPPHKPLPICRYPPPPKKGGPHHKPPHHPPPPPSRGPPGHGERPPPPPGHHEEFPEGHHGGPKHDDIGPPHEGHHGPPHGGPHGGPDHEEPEFDRPPPHQPGFEPEAPFQLFDDSRGPPGPPGHHPFDGPGPRRHGFGKAFPTIKFVTIGVLLSLLVIALHRRHCTSKGRAERKARRAERRRLRASRRAGHKHTITRWIARMSGGASDDESDDYEDKRQALLASAAEDGMSTTMTEEITEFRNAAEVVDDMVTATRPQAQVQPISIPSSTSSAPEDRPLLRDFDMGSQVGEGEELPAYEDNDGSEMSSVVADGFRYTPGSTEYSPSHSPAGSVSDILGPDTKQ